MAELYYPVWGLEKVYPMRQDVRNRANMTPVKMKIERELGIGKEKGRGEESHCLNSLVSQSFLLVRTE